MQKSQAKYKKYSKEKTLYDTVMIQRFKVKKSQLIYGDQTTVQFHRIEDPANIQIDTQQTTI